MDGDIARVTMSDGDVFGMRRDGKTWKIDAGEFGTGKGIAVGRVGSFFAGLGDALEEAMPEIGKPGVTPDTLDAKLGQQVMRLMGRK